MLVPLMYNACNDKRLDLQPFSPTEAAFFKDEIDFERATLAIYAGMTDLYWYGASGTPGYLHRVWLLPGDDITTVGTEDYEIFSTLEPNSPQLGQYYRVNYQVITRANTLLEKIDEVDDGVYVTPNLKEHHRGEALFMRALMYFNLWNFFGTPPLVLKRLDITEITQPSSTDNQLLDQVITDLEEAASLLPAQWDASNRGRATANSANGLLGKALVFRGTVTKNTADFTAAVAAFNNITGVTLTTNYADNFSARAENNSESLFEFQASQSPGENLWLPNDFDNPIGNMSTYWGFYEDHWSLFGATPFIGTQKLVDSFEPGDPRLPLTVDAESKDFKKYVTENVKESQGVGSLNNPRILRYADVLLLKAEAILQSGGSTVEAIDLINQVRARARSMVAGGTAPADRNTAEADPTTVMNWIMQERLIELAGEDAHRWLDLRRWHIAGYIDLGNFDFSSARNDVAFNPSKHLLFPIPLVELDLNPNVRQNPNY